MPPKMAGKPKCRSCRHKRGERRLGSGIRNPVPISSNNRHDAKIVQKKPCNCNCHGE